MRICYLADASSSHTRKWCSYFTQRGCEVHVITFKEGEIDNTQVHFMGSDINNRKNPGTILKYAAAIGGIKKLVREINPDILHAHYATTYGLVGSLCGFTPYVLSVWGSDIFEFPGKSIVHRKLVEFNLKKADYIMSTSEIMKSETQRFTDKHIEVTPFGVDTVKFRRYSNGDKSDKVIIGTMKGLERVYGLDYLIRAFKLAIEENEGLELELVIPGEGSEGENLRSLAVELGIWDRVIFRGKLGEGEVIEAFNQYDIAVFPSLAESFGVAALEAGACEVPVVATRIGGFNEVTIDGKTSRLVTPGNVRELADAINSLVRDKELRLEMGRSARSFIMENYDLNRNFERIYELYSGYVGKNGNDSGASGRKV